MHPFWLKAQGSKAVQARKATQRTVPSVALVLGVRPGQLAFVLLLQAQTMAARYDVGTPLGGERKSRRIQSPLQEMDGVIRALDYEEEELQVPSTPKEAQPVTMAAISAVLLSALDEKLKPVTQTMVRLEGEVESLKKHVSDSEDMMQSNTENISMRLDTMDNEFKTLKAEFQKYKECKDPWAFSTHTPRSDTDTCTAVFGGFKGACSKEEADDWLKHVLKKAGAAAPSDTYVKCRDMKDFNGVMFGKYHGHNERDAAIKKVKESDQDYDGQKIWAKIERPIEIRTAQGILFAAKTMLSSEDWGFDKRSLWVDTDENVLKCGDDDLIMKTSIENHKLVIDYGGTWKDFIETDNEQWAKTVKEAEEKIAKKPMKGAGKGCGKGPSVH